MTPLLLLASLAAAEAAPLPAGHHPRATVPAPTRLDWSFVLATQSQPRSIEGYDSTKQTYELFVPTRRNPRALVPAIVFISPGKEPAGWKAFEKLAKAQGIL